MRAPRTRSRRSKSRSPTTAARESQPQQHPLEDPWTLYAHGCSNAANYQAAYVPVGRVATCEDWGSLWNHVHVEHIGSMDHVVSLHERIVLTWSFFREHIRPEWEDPLNTRGTTLTHRSHMTAPAAQQTWTLLAAECARGAFPESVNGIQITKRTARSPATALVRIDVWLRSDTPRGQTSDFARLLQTLTHLSFDVCAREAGGRKRNFSFSRA